jgi:hypothetical protein
MRVTEGSNRYVCRGGFRRIGIVPQLSPTEHRTIVVVDVADFTAPARTADMLSIHEGLYEVLEPAFAESGVDLDACVVEDRGDGALVLVPADFPKAQLADLLPDRLVAAVRRHNANRPEHSRFRLRLGLHAGDIRRGSNGWTGHSVNTAFRLIDAAEVKSALATTDGVVAMVVSDSFYTQVIADDSGAAPESYRRVHVRVKNFESAAWLRLPGVPAPATPMNLLAPEAFGNRFDDTIALVPANDLSLLHGWLDAVDVPNLPILVSRAAGPAVPVPRLTSAWDAFAYLADFNAGPDGVPPALAFLSALAAEVGGNTGTTVVAWVEQQARRLRLGPAIEARRGDWAPLPTAPQLYLVITMEPDAIDMERCVLSYWRQDDPLVWPPARGGVREVHVNDLEHAVDDIVVDAEDNWADHRIEASVEFVLPRSLLHLPVHQWRKEISSGNPRPLSADYEITIRSLERMRTKHWHRAWHLRWDSMLTNPSSKRVHFPDSPGEGQRPIDAVLSDPQWVGLVMTNPPEQKPPASPDELTAALRAGLPLILWHPDASAEELRKLVAWLLDGSNGYLDIPARHKAASTSTTAPVNSNLARDLVVMWDDPKRVIVLDEPSIPSRQ